MNLLAPVPSYAPAGLKSLLVGPWVTGASYVYASAQRDIIATLDPAAIWWPIDCRAADKAAEFGEGYLLDKQGPGYAQSVAVALPGLAVATRAGLQNVLGLPLLALCQDMRGAWWLLGQDAGLRLLAYTARSGPSGGETATAWQLTGRQREAARQVALGGPVQVVDYGFVPGSGGGSPHTLPFTLA